MSSREYFRALARAVLNQPRMPRDILGAPSYPLAVLRRRLAGTALMASDVDDDVSLLDDDVEDENEYGIEAAGDHEEGRQEEEEEEEEVEEGHDQDEANPPAPFTVRRYEFNWAGFTSSAPGSAGPAAASQKKDIAWRELPFPPPVQRQHRLSDDLTAPLASLSRIAWSDAARSEEENDPIDHAAGHANANENEGIDAARQRRRRALMRRRMLRKAACSETLAMLRAVCARAVVLRGLLDDSPYLQQQQLKPASRKRVGRQVMEKSGDNKKRGRGKESDGNGGVNDDDDDDDDDDGSDDDADPGASGAASNAGSSSAAPSRHADTHDRSGSNRKRARVPIRLRQQRLGRGRIVLHAAGSLVGEALVPLPVHEAVKAHYASGQLIPRKIGRAGYTEGEGSEDGDAQDGPGGDDVDGASQTSSVERDSDFDF